MNKAFKIRRVFCAFLAVMFCNIAFAESLVYLDTAEGAQRLDHADFSQQYFSVAPYIDTQENLGFCGPASMAAALNSLPTIKRPQPKHLDGYAFFTQRSLFTPQSSQVKTYEAVASEGFQLQQASAFLTNLDVSNRVAYGSDLTIDQLRSTVKTTLADKNHRIIVDFDRRVLDQKGSGHFSPIGAYDSATDSVLVLDVAKFKYPPFWVSLSDLLKAIKTIDPDSGRTRGLLIIETTN